jgi:hypothetical protein
VEIPPEPRRAAVYVSYSAAVAFAVLVIGFAMARDRFARRSRRRLSGHSHTVRIGDGDDP